jgi:hypothetical protein
MQNDNNRLTTNNTAAKRPVPLSTSVKTITTGLHLQSRSPSISNSQEI